MNTVFITLAEGNARNKTNTSAAPEDDLLKVRLGIVPPAKPHSVAVVTTAVPVAPGSVAVHVDGTATQSGVAPLPVAGVPVHNGAASLNGTLVKPDSLARANKYVHPPFFPSLSSRHHH